MTSPEQPIVPPATAPRKSNTLRTVLLVVGSIVLAIILIGTAFRVAYSLNREDTSGTFTVQESFEDVEIRASAADVDVSYSDVAQAEIAFDQGDTNLRLDREVSNGTLKVTVEHPGWGWFGWGFGDWGLSDNATLTLTLPQELEGDSLGMTIHTTAGDLDVLGEFGDVAIESTAGNVRMEGAVADLEISTTAGDVRLEDLTIAGSFRSESTAGNGTFEFATLPESMDVQSTAGDVNVVLPRGSYRIETDTTAGEVRQNVSSDQQAERVYRFETTAGNIQLDER